MAKHNFQLKFIILLNYTFFNINYPNSSKYVNDSEPPNIED